MIFFNKEHLCPWPESFPINSLYNMTRGFTVSAKIAKFYFFHFGVSANSFSKCIYQEQKQCQQNNKNQFPSEDDVF